MGKTQIKIGSQGSDVEELQTILNKNGYNLAVDGIFGKNTQEAVLDYQGKNGLTKDAIVGEKTWGSLLGGSNTNVTNNATNNGFKYNDFQYKSYKESDLVKQAQDALNAQLAQKPGAYQSQWQTQLNDIMDKIMNREKFSYDLNGDALYQQYKDKFVQQGKLAMGDAIGQASAMTGGYGNSYAQSVGQQAYQAQLNNLNDIVPELYQMAYDKYNQEGQDLLNQYAMVGDREDRDYGRYRDSVADWTSERDYLANRFDSERDFDYSKYNNERDFAYNKYSDDKSYAYQDYRDKIEDAQWQANFDEAVRQFDESMALKTGSYDTTGNNTTEVANKGTTPGGNSYDNGSLDAEKIKALQKALGVTADGKYGPKSQKAAGGLSAEEAYKKFVLGSGGNEPAKGYFDFNNEEYNNKSKQNGGSHYSAVLSDLKAMKANGKSSKEAQAYLEEMVGNSYITQSDYMSLYNKYRDGKLG